MSGVEHVGHAVFNITYIFTNTDSIKNVFKSFTPRIPIHRSYIMPKNRIETETQFLERTATPVELSVVISGSTTSTGILAYTHSLSAAPRTVVASIYGTGKYSATIGSISSTGIDINVFTGSNAANAAALTASLYIRP